MPKTSTPSFGWVRDSFGNLYGTANRGGDKTNFFAGCGVAFTIAPNGQFRVLYEFTCEKDGGSPHGLSELAGVTGSAAG